MSEDEYIKKCEEILSKTLPVETPDELMNAAVEAEALGYLSTKFQAKAEKNLRQAEAENIVARAEAYNSVSGKSAEERKAKVDATTVEFAKNIEMYESQIKYYRNISILIDRRVGLAQSTLANFSAQIKAGIITR